jgi:hypothetical protein
MPVKLPNQSDGAADFSTEVGAAVQQVRQALFESLTAVGLDAAIPLQVAKALGIDKSLSWKVCRIVTEPEPVLVASRLPGRPGMKIVAKALRKAGVAPESVQAIEFAVERFRLVEARHAGDRETLTAMLSGTAAGRDREEFERRRSFLGNSATWGVRARLQMAVRFLSPSSVKGKLDLALANGFCGFQRLSNDLPWSIANLALHDDQGRPSAFGIHAPIDPEGMTGDGVPLVPEFCTSPLPSMKLARLKDGAVRLLVGERPLGKAGTFDVMAAWTMRGVLSMYPAEKDEMGSHLTILNTPTELLIQDLFVHKSLAFAMNPRASVHSQLHTGPLCPQDGIDAGLMRLNCTVENFGTPPDLTTPEFRRYGDLANVLAGALGHSVNDFMGYRLRLKYPPIPALTALRHGLASPPR